MNILNTGDKPGENKTAEIKATLNLALREMTECYQKIKNKNKNQANLFFPSIQEHRDTLITHTLLTGFNCYGYNHQPFSHVLLLICDTHSHGAF